MLSKGSYIDSKPNRRGCRLLESNEDWQFADPLVVVSKDGEVKAKREPPARAYAKPPKMRSIREVLDNLNKEVDGVKFFDLPMDKQIRLIADEYSAGTKIHKIEDKLGISKQAIYNRLDKARAMGLVVMRGSGSVPEPVKMEPQKQNSTTSSEDFAKVAADKLAQAEKLAKEAERLQQAGKVALALEELLGDRAGKVLEALYSEVAV